MPTRTMGKRFGLFAATGVLLGGLVAACSAATNNTFGSGANAGSAGGDGVGAGKGTGGGSIDFFDSGTSDASEDAASCGATSTKAEQLPLDMFIMLDQSGSMGESVSGGTKWTAVTSALTTFVQQPGTAGISVGIQYFGLTPAGGSTCSALPFCATDADCGGPGCGPCVPPLPGFPGVCQGFSGGDSCNPADYAKAEVEIAPLPGVANAIIASLGQHSPTTGTPTSAALQGAINHAKTWAQAHPNHVVIALFATDGQPSGCDEDLGHIDAIAAAGVAGTPKVLTFVIGVGSALSNLNGIAAAGGTGQAFIVDTAGNTNQQFLDALNKIRGAALGCNYAIPPSPNGDADFSKVNVQYTPGGGGSVEIIPRVDDKAHCPASGDAWYYDNPSAPTQIILCDATCNKLSADDKGQLDILLGCKTILK